jgi:hypothetical protein
MKLSRVIFLTIILILGNTLFYSCCRNSCGCGEIETSFFKVTNYKTAIRQYILNSSNSPYNNPVLVENSTSSYDEMAIIITPEVSNISYLEKSYSMPGIAFACDPGVPSQTFTDISIISDSDYQTATQYFSAGENLAAIFNIYDYGNQKSIVDFLSSGTNYASHLQYYFLLTTPPAFESLHRFTITIKLSDGSIIDSTTTSIKILS